MFFKLALRNVRRCMRDYLVYFLTLMLSVCIFYVFNSLDAQLVMLELAGKDAVMDSLDIMMGMISLFVSAVLAFLFLYANGFIMKRRSKEMGLYMILGISAKQISLMLFVETLMIGILALVCGLLSGYVISQSMSVLTAQIFQVPIKHYTFVFSPAACMKTCIYFGVIFLLLMIFDAQTVTRQKISVLLSAGKRNEKVLAKKYGVSIFLLTSGIILCAVSYQIVFAFGQMFLQILTSAVAINFLGTLLIFYGISGIVLSKKKTPSVGRLRNLRIFSERQVLSRVNTNAISMSFICTMIFLTLVIVSSISSLNALLHVEFEGKAPFDVSITGYTEDGETKIPMKDRLKDAVLEEGLFVNSQIFSLYDTDVLQGEIARLNATESKSVQETFNATPLRAMGLSTFNKLLEMRGLKPISMGADEFALTTSSDLSKKNLAEFLQNPKALDVHGMSLDYYGGPIIQTGLWTTSSSGGEIFLIVPDETARSLPEYLEIFNANYAGDKATSDKVMQSFEPKVDNSHDPNRKGTLFRIAIGSEVRTTLAETQGILAFIGLYIGMIFLLGAAAISALQQLSGAADERPRYELLAKLGASRQMMDKAIFFECAVYFLLPLFFAVIHSAFGIGYMVKVIGGLGWGNIFPGAVLGAFLIVAIYGVYFAATYLGCRAIIHTKPLREE